MDHPLVAQERPGRALWGSNGVGGCGVSLLSLTDVARLLGWIPVPSAKFAGFLVLEVEMKLEGRSEE